MPTLQVDVVDKTATLRRRAGWVVCCNTDYIVQFTFDEEWDGVTDKVARFVYNGQYYDRAINAEGVAEMPRLSGPGAEVKIGVYSLSGEDVKTTTSTAAEVFRSILDESATEHPGEWEHHTSEAKEAADRAEAAAARAEEHLGAVVAPVNGFFTMAVDVDGNLYAYSSGDGTIPEFEYDENTGELYFITEED